MNALAAGCNQKTSRHPVLDAGEAEILVALEKLRLDAIVTLTVPLDRRAGRARPRATHVDVKELRLVWGRLVLSGSGSLAAAADGLAEGRIALRLTDWRDAVPARGSFAVTRLRYPVRPHRAD